MKKLKNGGILFDEIMLSSDLVGHVFTKDETRELIKKIKEHKKQALREYVIAKNNLDQCNFLLKFLNS